MESEWAIGDARAGIPKVKESKLALFEALKSVAAA